MAILQIENLRKNFGALAAVDEVSLQVEEGELRAIIGPNGAGKTSLFNLISGRVKLTSGRIIFDGQVISNLSPWQICQRGIARSFQITNIFLGLTVHENIRIAMQSRWGGNFNILKQASRLKGLDEKASQIVEEIGLTGQEDYLAENLSHGDQRHLEIGIALATQPRLLILDEPTAGMSPEETRETVQLIKKTGRNLTVLLIEHDMEVVFSVSDRIAVMSYGRIIAEGTPQEVRDNPEVQRAYLGTKK